ncbi:MAG TPA: hypothetical protein VF642_01150 [Propionibacteriaceae bacterium]
MSRLDSALARWDNPRPLGSPLCAQGDAEAAADLGAPSCEAKSWATTAQVATNKVVALPEPVRLGLVNLADGVIAAATEAASTAPALPGGPLKNGSDAAP